MSSWGGLGSRGAARAWEGDVLNWARGAGPHRKRLLPASQFDVSGAHISTAEATALVHDAAATSGHGVTFSLGGDVVDQAETPYGGASNGVGVGAAAVVPLIAFGSLLAMGLPIATALMGIGSGLALIALLGFTGTKLARPSRLNTFLEGKVSELMLDYAAWIW